MGFSAPPPMAPQQFGGGGFAPQPYGGGGFAPQPNFQPGGFQQGGY